MIAMLMALGLAAQDPEPMRVRASTAEAVVEDFEAECVAAWGNPASVARAASASHRGYVEQPGSLGAGHRSWTSPYGSLDYIAKDASREGAYPQCNATGFTRMPVHRRSLEALLKAMVQRRAGRPVKAAFGQRTSVWRWMETDGPVALYAVFDSDTPQQITLTLQRQAGR